MLSIILFFILSVIIVAIVAIVAFEGWKVYLKYTKLKNFVVLNGLPVVGNVIELLKCDGSQVFKLPNIIKAKNNVNVDDRLALLWMGHMLFMYSENPKTFEHVLNSDAALKKAFPYSFLRNTKGIFTSHPNIWKEHRRALNPTLGPKMVNTFIPIFNEKAHKMVTLMEQRIGTNVDMHKIAFVASMDTTFSASYGMDWSLQNRKGEEMRQLILDLFERVQLRMHALWMKWNFVYRFTKFYQRDNQFYKAFHLFVESALEAKKIDLAEKMVHGVDELGEAKRKNNSNYLQKCLQLEAEKKFDDLDVCQEMETILIGSTDTTATVLSTTILMLAIHQDYQERVVEELRSIFDDVDEPATSEHLPMMTTLELVIKEVMRLFPVGPYLARELTKDFPIYDGVIPKGTQIILNVYAIHRKAKHWGSNALDFYPERFLPENSANYHPYQYLPFSAGPRNCIGIRYAWANLKISLSHLLRRYKFTTDLKMKDVKVRTGLILKIKNKDPVRLEPRQW